MQSARSMQTDKVGARGTGCALAVPANVEPRVGRSEQPGISGQNVDKVHLFQAHHASGRVSCASSENVNPTRTSPPLMRVARNPRESTPLRGRAPSRRLEPCTHGARMWQPESPTGLYHQPTAGSPGGSSQASDRARGARYGGHPCPSALRPQPMRSSMQKTDSSVTNFGP